MYCNEVSHSANIRRVCLVFSCLLTSFARCFGDNPWEQSNCLKKNADEAHWDFCILDVLCEDA